MQDFIKAIKALSDETRLRIVRVLLERECCVCEVMQALDISQTRASRNLKVLHDAGSLSLKKDGLWSLYSLDRDGMREGYNHLVEVVKRVLESNPVVAKDLERLNKAERVGPARI